MGCAASKQSAAVVRPSAAATGRQPTAANSSQSGNNARVMCSTAAKTAAAPPSLTPAEISNIVKQHQRQQEQPRPSRTVEFNPEGLVVREVCFGRMEDHTAPVNENGIAYGFRQARDVDQNQEWALRPGYDTPYFVCQRRFSNYPDIVLRGTNEAYEELKLRIKAGPNAELPLYLGAKLARDPSNPKADKWMVRPGWDTPYYVCERCFSQFPEEVMRGTNEVYQTLERKIKNIGLPGSDPFQPPSRPPTTASIDEGEQRFKEWKRQVFDGERMCRNLYFNGGSRQQFEDVNRSVESIKLRGMAYGMHFGIGLYKPYVALCSDMQTFCNIHLQSNSFGPSGTPQEAAGEMSTGGPPLPDNIAAEHPAFVEWRNKFIATERMYQELEKRGNGTAAEYEEIMQQFRLRVIWTDMVEEAVGASPLRPYFVLVQIYLAILEEKVAELSRSCSSPEPLIERKTENVAQ